MKPLVHCAVTFACCFACAIATAQDPFAAGIRTTDPLTPEQEQKTFKLPPGFEIQLVASEPDILKPLNMAFDAQGRLWITETIEYPYAAPADRKGRDNIKILADTNGNGRADKITTFADGLNIPIGIYPYRRGAVAFSIPNITKFEDTDGDDVADRRTKLYGPFGFDRDTHGLNNSFRRGFDGWIYACHGFNNESRVKGTDGHEVHMHSGNTYRFRMDGSRIEQFTHGQVNPFGMTFDPLGNLFTADCHSKPIYQLLRDGYYPSFGKPHDGLGFVPSMMDHSHGSTAICGIAHYTGENFPVEYRGNVFTGNVMTSRVNRNLLEYHGSTVVAKELPDFVTTTDPWFRPVDIQLGPDGALYIADFYNRIIGHYEVPLDNPGRDRHRGRIWRIVYTGDAKESKPAKIPPSLADASTKQRTEALCDPNLTRRMLAMNEISDDRIDARNLRNAFRDADSKSARAHALWLLYRHSPNDIPVRDAMLDPDPLVRVHAMKVMSEMDDDKLDRDVTIKGLTHKNGFVRRAAADALGRHPHQDNVRPLLAALAKVPEDDVMLRHTIRMSLRNHFAIKGVTDELKNFKLDQDASRELASAALGFRAQRSLQTPKQVDESAEFIIHYLTAFDQTDKQSLIDFVKRAQHRIRAEHADALADQVQKRFAGDLDFQFDMLSSIYQGLHLNNEKWSDKVADWTRRVALKLFASVEGGFDGWVNTPIPYKLTPFNPWRIEQRRSADGNESSKFLIAGETGTGELRSVTFDIPPQLSFFIAGHNGNPKDPPTNFNSIRLRDAGNHAVIAESKPPRNDTAQKVTWNLKDHAGKTGYLEIIDGDDRRAYAWLAVGRFVPPVIDLPKMSGEVVVKRYANAIALATKVEIAELRPKLQQELLNEMADINTRRGAATLLCTYDRQPAHIAGVARLIDEPSLAPEARSKLCHFITDPKDDNAFQLLADAAKSSPAQFQDTLARNLTSFREGGEILLRLIEKGHVSRRLLHSEDTRSRLRNSRVTNAESRIESLTAGLQPRSEKTRLLVEIRQQQFVSQQTSLESGAQLFNKSCSVCHQLDGKGVEVGPQLDGIGNRGADRIIEDLLDPSRNVDVAFRTTTIVTTDGKIFSGLFRREQGVVLVFADNKGKEFTVPKDKIDQQTKTHISLMPENLSETLTEQQFYDLVAFLLTKRAKPAPQAR